MKSILEVLSAGATFLEKKGVESARLNMEHLLAHVLGVGRMDLYRQFDRPLSDAELEPLREFTARRATGEPLQHLLGTVEFYRFHFGCDERALIPRPESEELVEKVLTRRKSNPPGTILDMGCGTGVIGLSLAAGFPAAHVVLADASAAALALARENADRVADQWVGEGVAPPYQPLGGGVPGNARVAETGDLNAGVGVVQHPAGERPATDRPAIERVAAERPADRSRAAFLERLEFVETDLFAAFEAAGGRRCFDVMVANLPYIPRAEVVTLSREVQRDPVLALDGGESGLEVIERFLAGAARFAVPGALIALEHGPDQGEAIGRLCANAGLTAIAVETDMSRRPRFSFAVVPA